MIDPHLKCMLK